MKRYNLIEMDLKNKYRLRCNHINSFPFGMQITLRSGDNVLFEYIYDLNADKATEISEVIFKLNDYLGRHGDGALTEDEEIMLAQFILVQVDMCKEEWEHTFELEIP